MHKATKSFLAAISLSFFTLPLCAETAREQVKALSPGTELSLPAPEAAAAERTGAPARTLGEKLALFNYQKTDVLSVKRTAGAVHKNYAVETLKLRINDPLRKIGEFDQEYTFYRTTLPGPRPTVLVPVHFMGSKTVSDWAAIHFAKNGYNAVIITPRESLTDQTRPLNKLSDLLIRESIAGSMCIDLLETFPEVDKTKLYAFGISMGGIRTALFFGVEPRIIKAGEIVGGGDIPGIVTDTRFNALEKVRDARMAIEGIAGLEDFRVYMKKTMTVDPLDFAGLRNPEDIIMVISRGDRFVPDAYQEKLFNAFSRPLENRYPVAIRTAGGHLPTAVQYNRFVERFIVFFEGKK